MADQTSYHVLFDCVNYNVFRLTSIVRSRDHLGDLLRSTASYPMVSEVTKVMLDHLYLYFSVEKIANRIVTIQKKNSWIHKLKSVKLNQIKIEIQIKQNQKCWASHFPTNRHSSCAYNININSISLGRLKTGPGRLPERWFMVSHKNLVFNLIENH